jgi:hypothetical protein
MPGDVEGFSDIELAQWANKMFRLFTYEDLAVDISLISLCLCEAKQIKHGALEHTTIYTCIIITTACFKNY